jgi:soluble lytic murein transglycosylase
VADAYQTLIRFAPTDYYSLVAFQRLKQIDPARAAALRREAARPGKVEPAGLESDGRPPAIARAIELMRAGLMARAVAELAPQITPSVATGDLLVSYLLERAHRFDLSHGIPRAILRRTGEQRIDARTRPLFLLAYPPAFEDEIRRAAGPEGVDPMLLMSLAREESAFDPSIRSFAGAVGLVQLMESTANLLAKELDRPKVKAADLTDPALNLALSARYLRNLLEMFSDHPGLAVPSYNAGEGAVGRWLTQRGTLPFDEFVEEIPYKQTRDYTKRVLGSYQTYHYLYRPGEPFIQIDLSIPTARKKLEKHEDRKAGKKQAGKASKHRDRKKGR